MKCFLALLSIGLLLAGCNTGDAARSGLTQTASRQHEAAEEAADEYLACIHDIDRKTAREAYSNDGTRRDVVLDSCHDHAARYTVVQEQAYNNHCLASAGNSTDCDSEAVHKARLDTDLLLKKAGQLITDTSSSIRRREATP